MKILVLNCGGSSVKYQILDMSAERTIAKGTAERIGNNGSVLTHFVEGKGKFEFHNEIRDHASAISLILSTLTDPAAGAVNSLEDLTAVGHRVVHGGEKLNGSVVIDDNALKIIEECSALAPLHNPHNLRGIRACLELMADIPQVAVFDNAYHKDLPDYVSTYAFPYEYYKKYGIRRYGFHGIAFTSMTDQASTLLEKPLAELRLVNLMLGSGTTANALKYGKSMEVSTGFTPCEGLVQSTRCGDIDPAVITWLMKKEGLSPDQMDELLNKKSGWYGISGIGADLRDIISAAGAGDRRAALAIEAFCHRCRKYIGAYAAVMGGADALVFSGGVGEQSSEVRERICKGLEFLGIFLDPVKNVENNGGAGIVSQDSSPVKILVVKLDEEMVIARETKRLVI